MIFGSISSEANLDKEVAECLIDKGVTVVGFSLCDESFFVKLVEEGWFFGVVPVGLISAAISIERFE